MAASWFRNIQGQLTEFATEVLNEAQNEVDDPESELQVEKKKSVEFERLLQTEKTRTEELTKQNKSLEDQLYSTNMEMDAIGIRFQNMVESRDQQIKSLKSEVEQLRHQCEEAGSSEAPPDLREQVKQLKAEVNHWKRIVKDSDSGTEQLKIRELEKKLEELRNKQQDEIAALMSLHQQNLAEEREQFEARIAELQGWGNEVSVSSEVSVNVKQFDEKITLLNSEIKELYDKMTTQQECHRKEIAALTEKYNNELKEVESKLANENDGWNCEDSGMSLRSEENEKLESEVKKLTGEVCKLERQLQEERERASQLAEKNLGESSYSADDEDKKKLEMENVKLYDDLKALSQKLDQEQKKHQEEIARLEQVFSDEMDQLRNDDEVKELSQKLKNQQQSHQEEVARLLRKSEMEQLRNDEELKALSEKLDKQQKNHQEELALLKQTCSNEMLQLRTDDQVRGLLSEKLKEQQKDHEEELVRLKQMFSDEIERLRKDDEAKKLSQRLEEQQQIHQKDIDHLRQTHSEEIEQLRCENAESSSEVSLVNEKLELLSKENEDLKIQLETLSEQTTTSTRSDELLEVSSQECARLRVVLEGMEEENKRLFEFIDEKVPKSSTLKDDEAMPTEDLDQRLGRHDARDITDKDAEIRRLRMEIFEMLKAYNELNDEYNEYKVRQEANEDNNSVHRDFTDRIDSLKASLIEYEERYEQCKRENSETVAQLERLTLDFEKLRLGMSCAAPRSSESADTSLNAENKQLKELLKESMDDKEKLMKDTRKFQDTVSSIENELENLRGSNRALHSENASLRETLNNSRDRVSETSALLGGMRSELSAIREASKTREETLGARIASLETERDQLQAEVEQLKIKALDNDTSLARYRAVVGHDGANIVEMKHDDNAKKSDSSEASNNDWERTGAEWTTDQPLSSNSSTADQRRLSSSSDAEASSFSPTATKRDIEKLEEKLEHALAEVAALNEEKRELERTNNELLRTVGQMNVNVEDIRKSFNSLSNDLENMKVDHSQLVGERDNLLATIQDQATQLEEKSRLEAEATAAHTEMDYLKSFVERLEKQTQEQADSLDEFRTMTETLKEEQTKTSSERDSLLSQVTSLKETLDHLNKTNAALNVESAHVTELRQSLEAKHNESVMYYTKLQELAQLGSANDQKVIDLEAKLAKTNQELALSFEDKEKLVKELKRLREHLVMMEETSTREAVAAEERETQLRKTVRMLEEKTEAATDTVLASSNQYQQQLAELTEKLESRDIELAAIQTRLLERERSLSDTNHEKEVATYEEEMDGLRQDMQKATVELNAMKANASEWDEERRFIEDTVAMQKEDMLRKDKIMEELENQIEELRHANAEVNRASHKIDDTVLRQLFLSYFTASKDKQGEIALLLASVLEYPQEDIVRIHSIVQQSSRGWFSWMGAVNPMAGAPSITEQFIRFLEHESLAVRQQTALPVESTAVRLPLEDSVTVAQSKSSSDDLKSILES
ncbi:hypothetical protein QR680_013499 [Steinernema hermaphroditum]|uniref:GRIP domain-containing protein n=1 Tax=Steinernema hermaphroditum TaxID=289476 RepID=A0AA39M2D6_9BILA|nr:hypothetical protein QR680_013499 [Steinernema hermaphroditum]